MTDAKLTRLEIFAKIYEENKDKIEIPAEQDYSLSALYVNEWIKTWRECKNQLMAKYCVSIANVLRYVRFAEFKYQLMIIANELIDILKLTSMKDHVVLIINKDMRKSNLWTGLLIFEYLKPYLTDVYPSYLGWYDDYKIMQITDKNMIFLYVDDMPYRGNQLSGAIAVDADKKLLNVIAVPYIGTEAKEMFTSAECIIPSTTQTILSFKESLEKKHQRMRHDDTYNLGKLLNIADDTYPIYFNHKLADAASATNTLFALGPTCSNVNISLISQCQDEYSTVDLAKHKEKTGFVPFDYSKMGIECPKNFYKHIDYTYNGISITGDLLTLLGIATLTTPVKFGQ